MSVTLEDLTKLMYDAYGTAAVKHGWQANGDSRVPWAFVPEENRAAMRDSVAAIEEVIREDERTKQSSTMSQVDLKQIMEALGISTHAPRSYGPNEIVQKEVIPKIRKMKKTLVDVRTLLGKHYIEARDLIEG
jgi:hypothetical protein